MTSTAHESGERQPIDPNMGLGEFLTAMQLFAGVSQSDISDGLETTQQTVSRWMRGVASPHFGSKNAKRIQHTFELTTTEIKNLIDHNEPWDKPDTTGPSTSSTIARRRLGEAGVETVADKPYAEQMLAAFVIRAEQGPPLNEVEAELVKFLVQTQVEIPANQD